jgi:hypothetical protein
MRQMGAKEVVESTKLLQEHSRNPAKRIAKWRISILLGAFFCALSLTINVVITILAMRSPMDTDGYRRTLFQGDCDKTRRLNVVIHLVINLLSTVILASSNYAMQCLSAPTRTELDRAHEKSKWLDIGVLSFRNLAEIGRAKVIFWTLLAISSLTLHLV